MWSCDGTWVGLSVMGKGPGILRAVLGSGLMVACELSIPMPHIYLRGWQRGAQRSQGSVRVRGEGRRYNNLPGARSRGLPVCVCGCSLSPEARRSGMVLAWLGSDCHPVGK